MVLKRAFSLIELLIALIIISLLLSAFIPLVTKKLKASDITVGSFSSNTSDNNTNDNTSDNDITSQSDCDKISSNLLFIPKSVTGTKNLCVMKYNAGDGKYSEIWSGVQKCVAGSSCTVQNGHSTTATKENLTPTCWLGITASNCNSNYGGYDGCTRSVCNWTGANKLCTNLGYRLPTQEELQSFTNISYSSNILASDGLMFCDYATDSTAAPLCPWIANGCTGTFNNYCHPYHVWSSTFSSNYFATSRYLDNEWHDNPNYLAYALSTRCVIDEMPKIEDEEEDTNEPTKEFCDKFNAYFIDKTSSGLSRNICITKYNVGDGQGTSAPAVAVAASVSNISVNQSCPSNTACCWSGKTADDTCTSAKDGGSYSGCNRTVCNYEGAYLSCYNWQYNDIKKGSWRLPNAMEIAYIAIHSATTVKNLAEDGMQFCVGASVTGFTRCYWSTGKCKGTNSNNCMTYHVWLDNTYNTENITKTAAYCDLGNIDNALASCKDTNTNYTNRSAMSVRCVYDGLSY